MKVCESDFGYIALLMVLLFGNVWLILIPQGIDFGEVMIIIV